MAKGELRSKNIDMTDGHTAKLILAFSLPLLLGNVFQQLYNMVDSIVVGNYVGKQALAAVGTGFPIIFMLSSLFMGIGIGATILISQFYGARDFENMSKTANSMYTALAVISIPLAIVGILLSGPILKLMNVPDDTFDMANTYIMIVFIGIIGSLGFNINSGILQGLGDSKSSLLFLSVACVVNIVLDILFVVGFSWGVAGVAIATIIAQIVSFVFGTVYINKKYEFLHLSLFKFDFDKELFIKTVKLGIPAAIQQAIFSVGVMSLQALVNSYGSDFMAGYNAATKIDSFAFMPIQSFSTAVTTFVGQNIGAGKMERVRHGTRSTIMISVIFAIFIAVVLYIAGPVCLRLFSSDETVIEAGMAYLVRILPFYFLLSVQFTLNSVLRGAGQTVVPMISSILGLWLARIPAAYLLASLFGRDNLFFCYAAGWVVGILITGSYYFFGNWREKARCFIRTQENEESEVTE